MTTLTEDQRAVMKCAPFIGNNEIQDWLGYTGGTFHRILLSLLDMGLMRRVKAKVPPYRIGWVYGLTEEGREMMKEGGKEV